MPLLYEEKLIPYAKDLRKNATKQEKHLWFDYLKYYPLRFQRQKSIDRYIVDFYCARVRLAVELDGSQHQCGKSMKYDEARDETLNRFGIHMLRIANKEVDEHFASACGRIDDEIHELLAEEGMDEEEIQRQLGHIRLR